MYTFLFIYHTNEATSVKIVSEYERKHTFVSFSFMLSIYSFHTNVYGPHSFNGVNEY